MKSTLTLIFVFMAISLSYGQLPVEKRVDCHPDPDANEANCLARGCLFEEAVEPGAPLVLLSF